VGGEATVEFAGLKFHWTIPSEIAFELVRQLYRQNFDPAFTSTAKIDYAIGIPLTHLVTSMTAPIASGWSVCRVGLASRVKTFFRDQHFFSS
jgi:2,3-dihydroxyphenylpropionate 1,2-dioxygenase